MNSMAEYLFHEGTNYNAYDFLGSFLVDDKCTFRVWAPNAKKVFVTGDFCDWDARKYEMSAINDKGLYEITIDNIKQFDSYKYVIISNYGQEIWKADPYAVHAETRPKTASKVYSLPDYTWNDEKWMNKRRVPYHEAMNIYEVHLGSWRYDENGNPLTYRQLVDELIPYVKEMSYTHI